jgi:hypothetical protein
LIHVLRESQKVLEPMYACTCQHVTTIAQHVPDAGGLGLLVQKGEPRNDQLLFLQPFDARLWVTLLGTAFAAALVLKLISLYTPLGDRSALACCSGAV